MGEGQIRCFLIKLLVMGAEGQIAAKAFLLVAVIGAEGQIATMRIFGMHTIYVIQKDWKCLREFDIHSGLLAQRRRRVCTPNLFQRDRIILIEKQKNMFLKKSTWLPRYSPFTILGEK